jgi:hypothetical protein
MKRTWVETGSLTWDSGWADESELFLREATQVKNIWTPYGA